MDTSNPFNLTPFQLKVKELRERAHQLREQKNLPDLTLALNQVARQEGFHNWEHFMTSGKHKHAG